MTVTRTPLALTERAAPPGRGRGRARLGSTMAWRDSVAAVRVSGRSCTQFEGRSDGHSHWHSESCLGLSVLRTQPDSKRRATATLPACC